MAPTGLAGTDGSGADYVSAVSSLSVTEKATASIPEGWCENLIATCCSGAAVPAVLAGVSPALVRGRDAPGRRDACPTALMRRQSPSLPIPEGHRAGVGAVGGIGRLQIFVPRHATVIQHSARPGGHVLKIPAGEVGILEPAAGKVVAVNLPTDPVRLHSERPSLFHPHAPAAIYDLAHRDLVTGDGHFAAPGCRSAW